MNARTRYFKRLRYAFLHCEWRGERQVEENTKQHKQTTSTSSFDNYYHSLASCSSGAAMSTRYINQRHGIHWECGPLFTDRYSRRTEKMCMHLERQREVAFVFLSLSLSTEIEWREIRFRFLEFQNVNNRFVLCIDIDTLLAVQCFAIAVTACSIPLKPLSSRGISSADVFVIRSLELCCHCRKPPSFHLNVVCLF